jgi:hypothetical protein
MNEDGLDIPAFLRRENTPQAQAKCRRIVARAAARKIKNPPRRASRAAKMLGPIFGSAIKER